MKKQRIYFYTILQQSDILKIKKLQKTILHVIFLKKVPIIHRATLVFNISWSYDIFISKRAASFVARINRGNMRVFLRLMYDMLNDCKMRKKCFIQKPDALKIFKKTHIDHFDTLGDVMHLCSNVDYDLEEKVLLFSNKSFALMNHSHQRCMKHASNPFVNELIDLKKITTYCDVFSFLDTSRFTDEQNNSILLLL